MCLRGLEWPSVSLSSNFRTVGCFSELVPVRVAGRSWQGSRVNVWLLAFTSVRKPLFKSFSLSLNVELPLSFDIEIDVTTLHRIEHLS